MPSKTKHIQICHHFIRDHTQRHDIALSLFKLILQLADIFIKPLDEKKYVFICRELGMLDPLENSL